MSTPHKPPPARGACTEADLAAALAEHNLPTTWTGPDGTTYDLTRPLTDRDGDSWHVQPEVWPTVRVAGGRCQDRPLTQLITDYGPITQPAPGAPASPDGEAQEYLATRLTIAVRALTRLAEPDEMAGLGQPGSNHEVRARCRYAKQALDRIADLAPRTLDAQATR